MSPTTLFLLVLLALALAVVVYSLASRSRRATQPPDHGSGEPAYEPLPSLLTPAERSFFGVLEQALPAGCRLFAKVRLADILRPASSPSRSAWQSALNLISAKHVDFILCDPGTLRVLVAIELDDKSHSGFERGFRDQFVDTALEDARIPTIRIAARSAYSATGLRDQIIAALPLKQP